MTRMSFTTARCAALFVFALQNGDAVGDMVVRAAIRRIIRELGTRGCAAWVAQEYGDHPDTAAARMRWASCAVAQAFPARSNPANRLTMRSSAAGSPVDADPPYRAAVGPLSRAA